MPSNSRKAYTRGFILTEQEFRRIHDIVNTQMKKALIDKPYEIEFGLTYKNGVVNLHSDFESIFSEENIESSSIRSITMRCFDNRNEPTTEIFIEFRNPATSNEVNSIRYRLFSDERDWVFITSSQLEERIKRTRRIALARFFNRGIEGVIGYLGLSYLLIMTVYLPFYWLGNSLFPSPKLSDDYDNYYYQVRVKELDQLEHDWKEGKIKDPVEAQIKALKITQKYDSQFEIDPTHQKRLDEYNSERKRIEAKRNKYTIIVFLALGLTPFILPLTMYFRPRYVFYWGENMNVIDKRENIGKFLLIGVVFAILVSILSNYIYDALKR